MVDSEVIFPFAKISVTRGYRIKKRGRGFRGGFLHAGDLKDGTHFQSAMDVLAFK